MTVQPFYLVAQNTADQNGNVTLNFPQLTQSLAYTGSLSITPNLQPLALGYGAATALRTGRATWNVSVNGQSFLNFLGNQVVKNFQAIGRNQVTVQGFGVVPNTPVLATWVGWTENSIDVWPVGPEITGGGFPDMCAGAPVENLFQSPIAFHIVTNGPGATTALVAPGVGSGYWQLLSYTIGISIQMLSTNTGTRSCTTTLQIHGTTVDIEQLNIGAVAGTCDSQTISQDFTRNPITLGPVSSSGLDLVTGTTGADAVKAWASCLVMAI